MPPVSLRNSLGQGMSFTAAAAAAAVQEAMLSRGGEQISVLVAEDNALSQKLLRLMVERAGHRCTAVSDGLQAVDAVKKETFDVIFMDCRMPVMDGWAATERIRLIEKSGAGRQRKTPMYIVGLSADEDRYEACMAAGMDEYLVKPVKKADLARVLLKGLHTHQSQQNMQASPGKVLVAEHSATAAGILSRVLTAAGVSVELVPHGRAALDAVCSHHGDYALLLFNVALPVLDGMALVQQVRDFESASGLTHVPMFAIVGPGDLWQTGNFMGDSNVLEVIRKPVDMPALVLRVKQLLNNAAAAVEARCPARRLAGLEARRALASSANLKTRATTTRTRVEAASPPSPAPSEA
jgi:CheY-like chemotaxis protein